MGSALREEPLALIARACRRGPEDLAALAAIARGQCVEPERAQALVRAGLLRASKDGPRLPAELIAPVLALDGATGGQGQQVIGELVALLCGESDAGQRDVLLDALTEQLTEQLRELKERDEPPVSASELSGTLGDLEQAIGRLTDQGLSVSKATRLASLCAQLVEQLARHAQPARRKAKKETLSFTFQMAAAAGRGRAVWLTGPLMLPSPQQMAACAVGSRIPPATQRSGRLAEDGRQDLTGRVLAGASSPDPRGALYSGCADSQEALRVHAALIALGEEGWSKAQLKSTGGVGEGPAPLEWSSHLEQVRVGERAA